MDTIGQVVRLDRASTGSKVGIVYTTFRMINSYTTVDTREQESHRVGRCVIPCINDSVITISGRVDSSCRWRCVHGPVEQFRSCPDITHFVPVSYTHLTLPTSDL